MLGFRKGEKKLTGERKSNQIDSAEHGGIG